MADEMTIPALPCASIRETLDFYVALGFEITYQQARPNTYACVRRGGIELHFFTMKGYEPVHSYSTCLVMVPDVDALHKDFSEGLRARYGKVPLAGIPRMNKPNNNTADGDRRFNVIDPGGNWIRFIQKTAQPQDRAAAPNWGKAGAAKLLQAIHTAGILADSHGDYAAAAKLLDVALAREPNSPANERLKALVARAWVAVLMDDQLLAKGILADLRLISLTDGERAALVEELERAAELEQLLREEG